MSILKPMSVAIIVSTLLLLGCTSKISQPSTTPTTETTTPYTTQTISTPSETTSIIIPTSSTTLPTSTKTSPSSTSSTTSTTTTTAADGPCVKYAKDNGFNIFTHKLQTMDNDGIMDDGEKLYIDMLTKYQKYVSEFTQVLTQDGLNQNGREYVNILKSVEPLSQQYVDRLIRDVAPRGISDDEITGLKYFYKLMETGELSPDEIGYYFDYEEKDYYYGYVGFGDDSIKLLKIASELPDQEFAKYAVRNMLTLRGGMTPLEEKFLRNPEQYKQQLFDDYISRINAINPELSSELKKLPDFETVEMKDVEAMDDMMGIADAGGFDAKYFGICVDSMLNAGRKEKRKYSAPLEAMNWILYDYEPEYFLKDRGYNFDDTWWLYGRSNAGHLCKLSWHITSESDEFKSKSWQNVEEVVNRLDFPDALAISDYILPNKVRGVRLQVGPEGWKTPEETFNNRGGNAGDMAVFYADLLERGGYDASIILLGSPYSGMWANAVFQGENGLYYYIGLSGGWNGAFNTIDEAANYKLLEEAMPPGSGYSIIEYP